MVYRNVALLLTLGSLPALAGWSIKGEPSVGFTATGTVGLKFDGSTSKVDVKDDGKALIFTVALKDLDTGIGLRNRHMQEDLEAAKYPSVSLSVPAVGLKIETDGKAFASEGKGALSLHGKTSDVSFKYTATCAASTCDVEAEGRLNLKDFEVKVRSYMGVTVKPDVTIHAKFSLAK